MALFRSVMAQFEIRTLTYSDINVR